MKYCLCILFTLLTCMAGHSQTTYTFTGNGYWTQHSNWQSSSIPPDTLPAGSVINISPAPGDSCVLNKVQVIAPGASLNVLAGSNFIIMGGMVITASLPSLNTTPVTDIAGNYALSGGTIIANGGSPILSKGVVWSINPNPGSATGTVTADGDGSNAYGSYLRNLLPNTHYYIRAYATNSTGTGYGNEISFTTSADLLPVVSVEAVDTIRANTASARGQISSDLPSIVTLGFCWDTARLPTTALSTKTVKGTPIYSFIWDILTGLLPKSTYYIRAYATNSFGTAYSNEYSFITDSAKVPSVNLSLSGSFDALGSVNGTVVANCFAGANGSPITLTGICWDSVPNPTITSPDTIISGNGPGNFSGTLTNLVPNTTYYIRAFAMSAIGTGYSGTQVIKAWMPANLDIVTYRNGDTIPQVTDSATWANLTTGAWCYYNNDSTNGAIYGKLYNFYALTDPRGFAPEGWRLPTEDDWFGLAAVLNNTDQTGGRMKTTTLWMPPNTGATNSSRFSGLPGGLRLPDGNFAGSQGYYGEWWSDYRYGYLFGRRLAYDKAAFMQAYTNVNVAAAMRTGRSVRCIKE